MTLLPKPDPRRFRHRVHSSLYLGIPVDHIGVPIVKSVALVQDLSCLRVQPLIAFDQTHAVHGAPPQPIQLDKRFVLPQLIGILPQLCLPQIIGQDPAVCTPHIAPAVLLRLLCPNDKIQVVFGERIRVAAGINDGRA